MRFLMTCCLLVVFALLAVALPAVAAVPTSYTGQAPVNSQSDSERTEALKTALANVVIAQTGDSGVLARPEVARAVAQAERYVLQYQYEPNPAADSAGKLILVAQFDSSAVDRMLGRLGLGSPEDAAAQLEAPSTAMVWIGGVRSADDYARAIGYLNRNNFVRSAQPVRARDDGMLVELSLATALPRFLEVVGMERTLDVVNTAPKVDGVDATLALAP